MISGRPRSASAVFSTLHTHRADLSDSLKSAWFLLGKLEHRKGPLTMPEVSLPGDLGDWAKLDVSRATNFGGGGGTSCGSTCRSGSRGCCLWPGRGGSGLSGA